MSNNAQLPALKKALVGLKQMRAKLDAVEAAKHEPIAIVGIGCRYPGGADDPASFWQLLVDGVDAISVVPPDRWDAAAYFDPDIKTRGKIVTQQGGFLGDLDQFDAHFFGISPREARSLDPQQRLLLEVTWEALENAGVSPDALEETMTGVFVGICMSDYVQLLQRRPVTEIDAYMGSGNAHSTASGRLSYLLGLRGPSLSVDTACSSSLVAVHLAVQSLRNGECAMAMAGGTNRIMTPDIHINHSRANMLSPDGRCKSFAAAADGFARSEGCGVVVLKRLSDAERDGDHVYALIRGSAVNQDGRTSGLTVPNGPSQRDVIRQALANGRVDSAEIGYIEAHGTGTKLGDPIEMGALAEVFGKQPLIVGSVKANIAHPEAAAGVAGLIKAALCLHHEAIPPHLHFDAPSPHIDWERLNVTIPVDGTAWRRSKKPRLAGVSSFGVSGTNAHIVLAEAPVQKAIVAEAVRPRHLLALSAKDSDAFVALTRQYAEFLQGDAALDDVCFTANTGRAHHRYRAAVSGKDSAEMIAALGQLQGHAIDPAPARIAFLFTGQGAQYADMGRELYETQPTFRRTIDECAALLQLDRPLLDIIASDDVHETMYTQPALFAIEYALAKLWLSWGITPEVLLGHSIGEFVAACVAGVFSLADGLRLVAARGRLMQSTQRGAMVAVFASEERVRELLPDVSIGAINGTELVVLSDSAENLAPSLTVLKNADIRIKRLTVSRAFHSPLMEPILAEFEQVIRSINLSRPRLPLVSNLTGQVVMDEVTEPRYWVRHLRETVRFTDGMLTLHDMGIDTFIEVGPHPTLIGMGRYILPEGVGLWLPSLHRDAAWGTLLESIGRLYERGVDLDWQAFDSDYARRKVILPTYPFQRERFWFDEAAIATRTLTGNGHPLLGQRLPSPLRQQQFEAHINAHTPAYLSEHELFEAVVFPIGGYLEMVWAAHEGACVVEGLQIERAIVLPTDGLVTVQTIVDGAEVGIYSAESETWTRHASAQCHSTQPAQPMHNIAALRDEMQAELPTVAHLNGKPIIERLWRGADRSLGVVHLPSHFESHTHYLHPVLLNHGMEVLQAALSAEVVESGDAYIVGGIGRAVWYARPEGERVWCYGQIRASGGGFSADLTLINPTGTVIAVLEEIELKRTSRTALLGGKPAWHDWLYNIIWEPRLRYAGVDVPSPQEMAARIQPTIAANHDHNALQAYSDGVERLNQLSAFYSRRALAMVADDEIAPQYKRLTTRLREILAEEGAVAEKPVLSEIVAAEAALLQRCGENLADVLRGAVDPLELLFAAGDMDASTMLYQESLSGQMMNPLVQQAVAQLTDCLPAGQGARILEIGAGTGGTTAHLLPHCANCDYTFTDIGASFLKRAEERFADYPFLRTQRLDIERDPLAQGFAAHSFDVIVAANVLHATRDLAETLRHVRQLLTPNGTLILLEATERLAWADLTFGLTDGWWRFADEVRVDYPLISAEKWQSLLTNSGFTTTTALMPPANYRGIGSQAVIIAQADDSDESLRGDWLILADRGGFAETLQAQLSASGGNCQLVYARQVAVLSDRLRQANWRGIIYGWGLDATLDELDAGTRMACEGAFQLVQTLTTANVAAPLWIVTRQTQLAHSMHSTPQATLWGLGKVIAAEHPELQTRLVDLDEDNAVLIDLLRANSAETQYAFANGHQHVARLVKESAISATPNQIRANATYLVTGGLSGLGLAAAEWLVEQGARHLVLVARRVPSAETAQRLTQLEAQGVEICIEQVDVTDGRAVLQMMAKIERMRPPLRGIIHSAGVFDNHLVQDQSWKTFSKVLAPKVRGTWQLYEATKAHPLDFFVLFSSAAATLGMSGMSNYVAANSFMDSLAHATGRPLTSINWGVWGNVGSAAQGAGTLYERHWEAAGLVQMDSADAFAALGGLLGSGLPQMGVFALKPEAQPLFAYLAAETEAVETETLLVQLVGESADVKQTILLDALRDQLAGTLGIAAHRLDVDLPLTYIGMDSLMAIELRNWLRTAVQVEVTIPQLLEDMSVRQLAAFSAEQVSEKLSEPTVAVEELVSLTI